MENLRLGVSAVRHDMRREETVEEAEKNTELGRQTPKRKAAGSNPVQGASSEIPCLARIPALRRGFLAGQGISSLPNRNRCAGLRFGVAASRQVLSYANHIDFNRPSRVGATPALFRRFSASGSPWACAIDVAMI